MGGWTLKARWASAAAVLAVLTYHLTRLPDDARRAREIAAARPRGAPPLTRTPRVSVLVAAWNEREMLPRHLASVLGLSYPDLEYVLCAGGSDGTYELAAEMLAGRGVVLRQEPGEGKQRAVRRGLAHATGEIVYLTDADCVLDDAALAWTIAPLLAGEGAATGRSRPLPEELAERPDLLCAWAPPYVAESRQGERSAGLLGRNCAITRAALTAAGDMAEDVPTGTDYHLARSLIVSGTPIAFARWSFVQSGAPASVREYVRQQSRWLRNHWIHASRTGDAPLQLHAARSWLAAWSMFLLPLATPVVGWLALAAWLGLLVHGSAARARYVRFLCLAEGLPLGGRVLARAPLWFLIDAWAAARSLLDLARPSWRTLW